MNQNVQMDLKVIKAYIGDMAVENLFMLVSDCVGFQVDPDCEEAILSVFIEKGLRYCDGRRLEIQVGVGPLGGVMVTSRQDGVPDDGHTVYSFDELRNHVTWLN